MGEWFQMTLGTLCDFLAGNVFPKKKQGKLSGDYPFIKVSDMNLAGNERHITVSNNWISEAERSRLKAQLHPKGSVAFAKIGVALTFNRRRIIERPTLVDNNMMSAVPRTDVVDGTFFYYLLQTVDFNIIASGTALPYLKLSDLKKISVKIPPLPVQRRIAHILGTLDDKIELNRRMNRTLEEMAAAIFKSWFIDFDPVRRNAARAQNQPSPPAPLPVGEGSQAFDHLFPDSFQNSELGEIPKGWRVESLSAVCDRIVDKVENAAEWANVPLIDLARMPQRSLALLEWGLGSELTTSVTRFQKHDILFGAIRPYFHKVGIAPTDGVTNVSVFVIRARSRTDWPFVLTYCSMDTSVSYATRYSKGTKMPVVSWRDFAAQRLVLPSPHLREVYNEFVRVLIERIIGNTNYCRTISVLRDTLLPKLISGELSVPDADRILGRAL